MRNKKGFEVAANYIVIMVLAVSVLIIGIQFSQRFFDKAETMRRNLDEETTQRINALLDDPTQLVVNPFNKKKGKPGQGVAFGMGIRNTLAFTDTFKVSVVKSKAVGDGCDLADFTGFKTVMICSDSPNGEILTCPEVKVIPYTKLSIYIGFDLPTDAPPCIYIFDVTIDFKDEAGAFQKYQDDVYKLYIDV